MAGYNRSSLLVLIAAYLGLFVGLIDSNAVNLALPAIQADLGGGVSGAQWTADAYNVTFAAALLTAGSLGDRLRPQAPAAVGTGDVRARLAGLRACAASVRCWRAAQRRGSAPADVAAGPGHRGSGVPHAAGRARATAAWAMAAASSAALGPVLGGVLTDSSAGDTSSGSTPRCLVAIAMSWRYLPGITGPDGRPVDLTGQVLAVLSLAGLTLVLVEGRTLGLEAAAALAVAVTAGGAAFVWSQRRIAQPMVPPQFFRNRRLWWRSSPRSR